MRSLSRYVDFLEHEFTHISILTSVQQAKEAANQAGVKNLSYTVGDAVKLSELKSQPAFEAINGGCDLVYSHAVFLTSSYLEKLH